MTPTTDYAEEYTDFERYGNALKIPCPTCGVRAYQLCKPAPGHKGSHCRQTPVGLRKAFPHYYREKAARK